MKIAEAGFVRNECPREFQDTTDEILREFRVLINAFPSGEVRQCPLPSSKEPESYSRTAWIDNSKSLLLYRVYQDLDTFCYDYGRKLFSPQ